MTRSSLHLLLSVGLGLGLAGCGDDGNTSITGTGTGSASETDATSNPTTSPTSTDPTTTTDPTTGTGGGQTDSMSSTDDPETSGTSSTTDETATGSSTEPDETTGSTGPIVDTTGDDTTGTTGDDTTGTTGEDTTEGTTGEPEPCVLAEQHKPCDADSNDALHAIGLNCTSLGGDYVNFDNATSVAKPVFQAPAMMLGMRSWQVAESYGTYIDPMTQKPFWSAHEGDKLLMISSGLIPSPDRQGNVVIQDGEVYNDTAFGGQWDSDSMPPPMSPNPGSPDPMGYTNCDGVNDCSNTINDQWDLGGGDAEDKMWFGFELTAPSIANGQTADAKGYTFEFAYFSAEFPEYVGDIYNDIFVVWQNSEDYTGNVTFINGQPMTVTALWPVDYQGFDPQLEGTGFLEADFSDGGATGWYKATGGIKPGETFTLTFAIFDMGDSTFDTTALLDNWQWDCEGCIPNEVESCGIEPM